MKEKKYTREFKHVKEDREAAENEALEKEEQQPQPSDGVQDSVMNTEV